MVNVQLLRNFFDIQNIKAHDDYEILFIIYWMIVDKIWLGNSSESMGIHSELKYQHFFSKK